MKKLSLILVILTSLALVISVIAQEPPGNEAKTVAATDTTFTYQGSLSSGGNLVNNSCDFEFSLWDDATAGTQLDTTETLTGISVVEGTFTVPLDFGANAFTGPARWLEIAVQCPGDGGFTMLSPRQPLTPAPYALSLRPGAVITDSASGDSLYVEKNAPNSNAIHGKGTAAGSIGVWGEGIDNTGVYGLSQGGTGVWGSSIDSIGVYGQSSASAHTSEEAVGVKGISTGELGKGVYGEGDTGVYGTGNIGVSAVGGTFGVRGIGGWAGVMGSNESSADYVYGVYGLIQTDSAGSNSVGVKGYNWGTGPSGIGVWGQQDGTGIGVYGYTPGGGYGVVGESPSPGYAGYFIGNVFVVGTLSKLAGTFKIDHPLDPANKTLSHSFVESPDMMNIYNGNVTLDSQGEATVIMPDWFEALNMDFRYQLTPIGGPGPNLYIAQEISGNQFAIAGGSPGLDVSWQVTGIRHDPYAEENRIVVEEDKAADERGMYLYPQGYGLPDSMSISSIGGNQ